MKRGDFKSNRGVSPVIASVLLILLVLVLASLVFLWGKGFISEQVEKFGEPIEAICEQVAFDVELYQDIPGQDTLEVVNLGDVDINSLEIKKIRGGIAEISNFEFAVNARGSTKGAFHLNMDDDSEPEEILVTPILMGTAVGKASNRPFACVSETKELKR
jgi:flagellin-like protein|tara:strand:+ start:412 stop:891 length:480 start_codon:yes stop_codon:yes gene_type:complete